MLINYISWNPSPEIFAVGSFAVRWYGLLFASGFLFGYFIVQWMFKKEGIPQKLLDHLATYMVVATVIGARLGHCLFYEPSYYLSHPIEILKVWEGGLASHGATVGILIALLIFARKYRVSYLWVLDRVAVVTALAGFFIRMGNLMNSEIFGIPTDLPWGFIFVRASDPLLAIDPRHPTQIYEGLAYLIIFLILLGIYIKKHGKTRDGLLISLFIIMIFGSRFFVEFLKEPQVQFESTMVLNMGQILSIPLVLLAVGLLVYIRRRA